ncbi:DMT family transporter [Pedobacter sp.]|uniref:DMT family transporter n=1 Tax=Pedobacter sp. TaxID=1411316 RepID=UPI00396CDE9D
MHKIKGYALAIISAVSYGLIPLFVLPIKTAGFSLDTTLFYRFFISALFILAYLLYKKESLKVNLKEFFVLLILGLFYALSADLLFLGYDYLSPGVASTILFVYPVIVALIMVFWFKEKIGRLTILSLFITLIGILILSAKDSLLDIRFLGLFITLLCAALYALYIIIVNKAKVSGSGTKITFYSLIFSALYYLIKTSVLRESLLIPDADLLLNFILFALVTTVFSVLALVHAIKLIGSTPTSILGALEPVVAVCISVSLFGEDLTLNLIAGVLLILAGVIINIVADSRKNKTDME